MKSIFFILFLLTFSTPAFPTSIPEGSDPKPEVVGPGGGCGGGGGAGYSLRSGAFSVK